MVNIFHFGFLKKTKNKIFSKFETNTLEKNLFMNYDISTIYKRRYFLKEKKTNRLFKRVCFKFTKYFIFCFF